MFRLGRLLFTLLCTAGVISGLFLFLCAKGYLDPADLPVLFEKEEVRAVSAPAVRPQEGETSFQAVYLPADALDQAVFLSAACDGVIVPMKTPEGELGYVSTLEEAAAWQTSSGDPGRNQAIRELNALPDFHTVAMVSCLRDGGAGEVSGLALRRPSGSPWLDDTGTTWLDPTRPETAEYLIGICRELALLGFDEILLTHCAYPDTEDLDEPYGYDRSAPLETFCRQLQGALADLPVSLSILGEGDALGEDSVSGQTAALLASFPGRVWAKREDRTVLAAFSPVVLPVN